MIHNFGPVLALEESLKGRLKDTKLIDLTNPADDFTNLLQDILETRNVYGFGMELDARRYGKIFGKRPLCIGMHGEAIPLMGWKSPELYQKAYEIMDRELLAYAQENGIPYSACGEEFREFFRKLIGDKEETVMMSTHLGSEFAGVSGLSLSVPVIVKKGEIVRYHPLEINEIEQKLFSQHAAKLRDVYMAQLKELRRQFSLSRKIF